MQPTFKVELAKCLGFFASLGSFVFCFSATSTEWFIEKKEFMVKLMNQKLLFAFKNSF